MRLSPFLHFPCIKNLHVGLLDMFSWVLASGMFLEVACLEEVEVWVSLYEILFDSTCTTVDSKNGAEGVSRYDGTWVTGEWSGAGRVNGASGRSGGVNGGG